MSESAFSETNFLDATTTEALVRRPPIPAGSVLPGLITEVTLRPWTSQKPEAKIKSGYAVDLKIEIDLTAYPAIMEQQGGISKIVMTPGIMLETKEDGKTLDWGTGKNGALRRYRDALGMNVAGQPFSIRQMTGHQLLVKIKHRTYEGEFYDEVDSVAKL